MTFLYPLGLLGLVGVPILLLIYILKNRYTEQTIASTYMWTLSERFIKRRNPLSKITGIISLVLQILLITSLSLAVAHPIITLKGAADEYCFVLDGSASMGMETDGKTRFDKAKEKIYEIIDDAENGSVFSLVCVTDITETVFELEDDKQIMKARLDSLAYSGVSGDYTTSIGIAQSYFNENPSVLTYLVTDKDYTEHTNVEIINVSGNESNASVYDISYEQIGTNSYVLNGKAISYGKDIKTDVTLKTNLEDRTIATQTLYLVKDTETSFSLNFESENFYSLTVNLLADDALKIDNSANVYNVKSENSYKAILVSDTPFLTKSALDAVSNAEVAVMSTKDYKELETSLLNQEQKVSGYGLYIFDAYSPLVLPSDGTIWFIGPTGSIEGAGFSVQGQVELDEGAMLDFNDSSNSVMKKLTEGMSGENIYIKKYTKCGVYGGFRTIFSYMGNPLIFTGETDIGNRAVVISFNLHDSNFTLSPDYPIMLYNLLEYSFPEVIETTEYYCGETAEVNVIPGCTGIRVDAPSGKSFYADTTVAVSEFVLNEVGEYKITLDVSGSQREFFVYSSVPTEERYTISENGEMYSLRGEATDEGRDGEYDPFVLLIVLAALFFTAEWMVYCYDKYQLR